MRLQPAPLPRGLLPRFMSFLTRRMLGKDLTPAQVIYNRVPAAWRISLALLRYELFGAKLDAELRALATTRVAMLNGCAFCQDIKRAMAVRQKLGTKRFDALTEWRTSPLFDARERAALAYVEEATLHKQVSDETFAELRRHFDDRAIAELTLSNAIENFYNLLNVPLEIESDGLEALAVGS